MTSRAGCDDLAEMLARVREERHRIERQIINIDNERVFLSWVIARFDKLRLPGLAQ